MARECIGCLHDQPYDEHGYHMDPLDGEPCPREYYACICTRGPIERELRRTTLAGFVARGLTPEAGAFARGCIEDMQRRGYAEPILFGDWMSEAIEAAAELGL